MKTLTDKKSTSAIKRLSDKKENGIKRYEVRRKGIAKEIEEYASLKKEIEEKTQRLKKLEADIKGFGMRVFSTRVDGYADSTKTFLVGSNGTQVMYILHDDFLKINSSDRERIALLRNKYGRSILVKKHKMEFEQDFIDKYGKDFITSILMDSKKIKKEDKDNMLKVDEIHVVRGGVFDRLSELSKKSRSTVLEVLEDLSPVQRLKLEK